MKLQISHTITPDGWVPKPPTNAYNFLDWATKFHYWMLWIRRDVSIYPPIVQPHVPDYSMKFDYENCIKVSSALLPSPSECNCTLISVNAPTVPI